MPSTPAPPARFRGATPAPGATRFPPARVVVLLTVLVVLFLLGQRGRRQVVLRLQLDELSVLREQLQQELDGEWLPVEQAPAAGASFPAPAVPGERVRNAAEALRARLAQFDTAYPPARLDPAPAREARVSRATLENAGRRFAEALRTLTDDDEKAVAAGPEAATLGARLLEVRGDAFFGSRDWKGALDRYQKVVTLHSNRLETLARSAACLYLGGRSNESYATFSDLARRRVDRGDFQLRRGKLDSALDEYGRALSIESRLFEQHGRLERAGSLARVHNNRGCAFLLQGRADAAVTHLQKALEVQEKLAASEPPAGAAGALAVMHDNRGNALLDLGQPEAAIPHYERAIALRSTNGAAGPDGGLADDLAATQRNLGSALIGLQKLEGALTHLDQAIALVSSPPDRRQREDVAYELATSHNNRGVVLRAQGKTEAAIGEFTRSIELLTPLVEVTAAKSVPPTAGDSSAVGCARVRLDVAVGFSERSIDIFTRSRLVSPQVRHEAGVSLATGFRNRGYAQLAAGHPELAVADFVRATEVYSRLVAREGQKDLAPQLVRCFASLAWVHATHPDASIRDGRKAREYALSACTWSEWKAVPALEALAAACAEGGDFPEAIRWQEKAVELAPAQARTELRARLQVYQSRTPFRSPVPKADAGR